MHTIYKRRSCSTAICCKRIRYTVENCPICHQNIGGFCPLHTYAVTAITTDISIDLTIGIPACASCINCTKIAFYQSVSSKYLRDTSINTKTLENYFTKIQVC